MTYPTETQTSSETYTTSNGNEAQVTTTVWPAGIISIASEEPEPPGDSNRTGA